MKEQFAAIHGFPGYEASSEGRIFGPRWNRGRHELKQHNRVRGYRGASITVNGKMKRLLVHRLVLMAFNGPPPSSRHEALHLDSRRDNNQISNLKWGLHFENMLLDRGNNHSHKGSANPNRKLSATGIAIIRNAYANRVGTRYGRNALAKRFGVTEMQIWRIATKQEGGWKHENS